MTSTPATSSGEPPQISGVIHQRSPLSVNDTLGRLTDAIDDAGAKVFSVVDQTAEAEGVMLRLRETVLLIFGNPAAGTLIMDAAPLSALDLPLKILIWADDGGVVWMSYLSADWLAARYGLPADLIKLLTAPESLTRRVAAG